jgi:hypothetical protein
MAEFIDQSAGSSVGILNLADHRHADESESLFS